MAHKLALQSLDGAKHKPSPKGKVKGKRWQIGSYEQDNREDIDIRAKR
ncbi:hypothetical protein LDJ79_22600 [Vibrio tritonius]|uniref:Ribosome alternative rescue factor ArfA n=1 Tax=Vibrio tritonius TaxID=1435069 RepID=A0ABS7YVK4_9VIBR|nr:hypothetical protein [Vibrio tritonius]MCA2018921.1 hypothetical protein [Vibrio tritonius]